MEWWLVLIVLAPLIGVAFGAIHNSGQKNRFVEIGTITGKPMKDIIAHVGPPTSISATASGQLYQWLEANQAGHYHYAILADPEDKAVCYTHQSAG